MKPLACAAALTGILVSELQYTVGPQLVSGEWRKYRYGRSSAHVTTGALELRDRQQGFHIQHRLWKSSCEVPASHDGQHSSLRRPLGLACLLGTMPSPKTTKAQERRGN